MTEFADRVIERARLLGPLCMGIDPHPGKVPALFGGDTPEGLKNWGLALVEVARGHVAAIKPQVGLFERHGPEGMAALQAVTRAAMEKDLIVLMDAKRGDIGSTAEGYAAAYIGKDAPFPCDALTVNPYMGLDTLEPYVREAESNGKGVIVLTRTSNPGSADFQAQMVGKTPLYGFIVKALDPLVKRLEGKTNWSSLMMVTGATGPDEARTIRSMAPTSLFLVPGYGAQGAGAKDAVAGFVVGPDGLEGGLVNASRSVIFAEGSAEAETESDWAQCILSALLTAQDDLTSACVDIPIGAK